jgi:hypothetical protein
VKIRNLKEIEENLHAFFSKCIDQELNGKKVVEIDVNEVKKRLARL